MGDRSKEINPNFANNLKYLRELHGLTQAQIGKIVNKGDSTVRMWELRNSEPDHETLRILAKHFGVTIDYLLGYNANPPTKPSVQIPEKYGDVFVALNDGDKNLTQDDVDDIVRFIEFKKSFKK